MGKVYRKQNIEGITIPAVIHNSSYFLISMGVYQDGTIGCWHKSDLYQFQDDLKKGWVVPFVPTGKNISIFELGNFQILDAVWQYDRNGFYQHVQDVVKSLNPDMENIYRTSKREIEKWDKHRVRFQATPIPFKLGRELGYRMVEGDTSNIFLRKDGELYATILTIYQDKTVRIDTEGEKMFTMEEICQMFDENKLCVSPQGREWVKIEGLGKILLDEEKGTYVNLEEKKKEICNLACQVAGEKTAHDACVQAYHQYLEFPSEWNREALRKTYEAVPEHERMYLGDMDSKDSDYRRILFHPEQKREV